MRQIKKGKWLKHIDFFILDVLVIEGIYFTLVRLMISEAQQNRFGVHRKVGIAMFFIAILMYAIHDYYHDIIKRTAGTELKESIKYVLSLSFGVLVYLYLTKTGVLLSRKLFVLTTFLGIILLCVERLLYKRLLRRRLRRTRPEIVLITDKEEIDIAEEYGDSDQIKAAFIQELQTDSEKEIELINRFEAYRNVHSVDEAILDLHDRTLENRWIDYLLSSGLTAHIRISRKFDSLPNTQIEHVCGIPVLTTSNSVAQPIDLILKRLMDILGGLVGMVFAGIAAVIFGPIIKIQSPGPIFYKQTRIGRNGRKFQIYKFRSMYPDADARKKELEDQNTMSGFMFKVKNDPRVIPIGRFMRKYSIDELPQFWNVLKGDMSLVGTRPPTLDEWAQYSPHHRARMSAKPGLTGVWQVNGRNAINDFEEVVRMDTEYINNWNIFTDIRLILKTVLVVIKGNGE